MKRRMTNKIENYKILPKRLINKYMSLGFEQGYFSVSIEFKGCVMVFGGNYLQDFISYKNYTVGTDEDEDVFYGVCLTPNTDYIKIEIY